MPSGYMLLLLVLLCCLLTPSQQKLIIVDGDYGNDTSCKDGSLPCKTLYQALKGITDNTLVHILNGTYLHNTTNSTLTFSNVSIIGNGADATVVKCDNTVSNGSGFGFVDASNISIRGLAILGCGQLRNSTTVNGPKDLTLLLFRAALYYLNARDVIIDDVIVNNSIGMGVAMYDVNGIVKVTRSTFSNNSVPNKESSQYPGGGGFSVEFSFCRPGGSLSQYCRNYNNDSRYLFQHCTFDSNTATTVNSTHTSYPGQTYGLWNQQFGRGGGLSVFFKGYSINNTIDIFDCVFSSNTAVWGGGFHSDIVDHSTGNNLTLWRCNISNNHCKYNQILTTTGTGGGGVRIAFLFYDSRSHVTSNSVKFILCRFQFNRAYYGGGLSCRITKEKNVVNASNSLVLLNSTWSNNVARSGSGVDIISHVVPQGVSPVVEFTDCHFSENNNKYSNLTKFPSGIGALYADNIPVRFTGRCTFVGNQDSAVAGIATSFTFGRNTSVTFRSNHGWNGAAISLLGNAYIIVHDITFLAFINNTADTKGGAIYYVNSGQKDFVSTQRCLFYYYDLTAFNISQWKTKFFFSNNSARDGGDSIYCTTLLTCIWENLPGSVTVSSDDIFKVFNWTGKFNYTGVNNNSTEIATDTANITLNNDRVKIPPGQFYDLKILPTDDRHQISHPVFYAYTDNDNVTVDQTTTYISDSFIKLHGKPNTSLTLHLRSINSRSWSVSITVTLDRCPPGFFFNDSANVCKCSTDVPHQQYYGITDCDNEFLFAYLKPQFWAGYRPDNRSTVLTTVDCPEHYCNSSKMLLPDNSSNLGSLVCSHHRTGIVCGNCQKNYFVYINSPTYECGLCNNSLSENGVLVLIVSKYLPMTTFLGLIMFFDVSLVDGPLNSFILFSQILASMQLNASGKIGGPTSGTHFGSALIGIAQFCYNIWNLRFFEFLIPHFCVFKYNSAIPVIAQQYVPAFYILFLCVVFFSIVPWAFQLCADCRIRCVQSIALKVERMCIRLRYRWSVRNSVIHSLTTFLVLSYARITLVTFVLLTPCTLYGPGGQSSYYQEQRVWYDGTIPYFGSEHFPYAVVALVVLATFVLIPPLLLLSYPLLPVLMTRLGLEDNWIIKKVFLTPLHKFVPIFDAFQSCYKDKYRCFAGLLFIYRVMALAIFAFTPTSALNLAWLQGFLLIALLLHCIFQPYKKRWHNFIEGFILTILAAISIITFYRLFQAETTKTSTNVSFWMQIVLLYCPLVYFVVYVTINLINWVRPRVMIVKDCLMRVYNNDSNSPQEIADLLNNQNFPARLQGHDDDNSSISESSSNSDEAGDDQPEQQQQQQQVQQPDDDDVEMLNSVQWLDSNESSRRSPYGKNWATQ